MNEHAAEHATEVAGMRAHLAKQDEKLGECSRRAPPGYEVSPNSSTCARLSKDVLISIEFEGLSYSLAAPPLLFVVILEAERSALEAELHSMRDTQMDVVDAASIEKGKRGSIEGEAKSMDIISARTINGGNGDTSPRSDSEGDEGEYATGDEDSATEDEGSGGGKLSATQVEAMKREWKVELKVMPSP